jgi:hypothetical protein
LSGNEASLVYQLKLQKISHQNEGSPFGLIPMEKLAREFIDKYPDMTGRICRYILLPARQQN